MPTQPLPNFTIQTGSLWASGDDSTFTGTGGPAAFDPFTGQFADIVNSAGLATEAFQDTVYQVDAGDQVTFVIAVQNFGAVAGYGLKLRDILPVGFVPVGSDLTVTDGAGNALGYSGNLFSATSGLTVTPSIAAFNNNSGANVVLVTFTATASNNLLLPGTSLTNNAQIVSYAASSGGANLATNASLSSATTGIQTSNLVVTSAAGQSANRLMAGQTASFDITIALPEGSVQDLRIDEVLPQVGTAWLELLSVQTISIGGHLTASAPVTVQPNGSIQLGTVVNAADNLATAADNVVVRVTVGGGGSTAGSGSISTVVSVANPNGGTSRVTQTVTNTLVLGPPDSPPSLGGISASQFATNSTLILPFQTLSVTDADLDQQQTLTIHLSNPALGTLSSPAGMSSNTSGDLVLSGTAAVVEALARTVVFTPSSGAVGTETFSLTDNDGAGKTATAQSSLVIASAAHPSDLFHFPITAQTVLTSTATGSSTYQQVEAYAGAISNINTQFLYDGDTPLAIVAQQPGMLISSQAQQTAVQLQGGTNVLDMRKGSSFLISGSGSGTDQFLLLADQAQVTWNTIANFHASDSVILYGFTRGTSVQSWTPNDGAVGYTGATLRLDVDGNGTIDSSLTFAAKTLTDTSRFSIGYGVVGNSHFLSITAV